MCEYCNISNCPYDSYGKSIDYAIEALISKIAADQDRYISIAVENWKVNIIVMEGQTLVGEIKVNDFRNPENDYSVKNFYDKNYGENKLLTRSDVEYYEIYFINAIMQEIKFHYEKDDFNDILHPITIRTTINI